MYSRMFVFFFKEAMAKQDDSVSIDNKDSHNSCYNYFIVFLKTIQDNQVSSTDEKENVYSIHWIFAVLH